MPETAMDEDSKTMSWKIEVGTPGEIYTMPPPSWDSFGSESSGQRPFGWVVPFAAYLAHQLGPSAGGEWINTRCHSSGAFPYMLCDYPMDL